ncbi:MAG: phosphate ABC transporter substrate-binding protein [Chloroflexi bacterium]|nr:phosphate ABC transporter substrate-binding protein [Chloroflexota bacterium]
MKATTFRVGTFLAPNMLPVYQSLVRYIGDQLGLPTELVVGTAYDELFDYDACFICGLPYILYTQPRRPSSALEAIAAPILQGERYQNRPIYFSDVIVRHDSPYQTFVDLRGCSWAYNEPLSQSGYGITRYTLVKRGETRGYFGKVAEAGFHQKAIALVSHGEMDAAAIDSHVLAIALRDHPDLWHQVRVIDTFGPSTIQPFAVASRLPTSLKSDIQAVLVHAHTNPAMQVILARGLIERFVAVQDADYDDIRQMLSACEQADFMVLR